MTLCDGWHYSALSFAYILSIIPLSTFSSNFRAQKWGTLMSRSQSSERNVHGCRMLSPRVQSMNLMLLSFTMCSSTGSFTYSLSRNGEFHTKVARNISSQVLVWRNTLSSHSSRDRTYRASASVMLNHWDANRKSTSLFILYPTAI